MSEEIHITRERLIQLLNDDLSREYQAIIAYVVYSQTIKGAEYTDIARELEKHAGEELSHALKIAKQIDYLGGSPMVYPKPVVQSQDPVVLLHADLENERATLSNYRQRIRQAEAMGEFALSEILREIIGRSRSMKLTWPAPWGLTCQIVEKPAPNRHANNPTRKVIH